MNEAVALSVEHALKTFGKHGAKTPAWWPRLRRGDGSPTAPKRQVLAVNDVSLTVHRGEILGILGPNGSGKSTLVRLVATLLEPDGGQITVFGHDVQRDEMAVKRLINRVSVEAAFFKRLSPMENLMYAARLYGVPPAQARREAQRILARLGVNGQSIHQPVEEMSRGMQQKVAIARAFLSHPILLLLDEPTTGLDPRSKREVQAFVRELRDSHDATILLTTHDMQEADALCDRVAIMDEGRIVALDTPWGLRAGVQAPGGHEATLEDVFMGLTGKALHQEEPPA
ncbi:MAG: ABC transporter ATP-binding protein [Chloroflexi bacterium]|nr:ABC transporter ATP-binding protein [Chloroflexota bacterium]